jgi:guanylate cyclase soluble subunit beta
MLAMSHLLQYGFVNYALELLVVKTFGEETWEQIK